MNQANDHKTVWDDRDAKTGYPQAQVKDICAGLILLHKKRSNNLFSAMMQTRMKVPICVTYWPGKTCYPSGIQPVDNKIGLGNMCEDTGYKGGDLEEINL